MAVKHEVRPMSYETFKVIHLLGVMLFLGNIIVTGVWKVLADRTGRTAHYRLCAAPGDADRLDILPFARDTVVRGEAAVPT